MTGLLKLAYQTPLEWVERVAEKPLLLLSDHAHNELKAAATAQAWLQKHPGKPDLVRQLARVAAEETEHFVQVIEILYARGGVLLPLGKNLYAEALLSRAAATRQDKFLDRLIVAGLIEARSCERFQLLAQHLEDRELRELYAGLVECELGHRELFLRLAYEFFPHEVAEARSAELFAIEGEVIARLGFDYYLHSGLAERVAAQ
ncbi:MAG: tRNA isopentenyl-2-thiomethyl-A-37 hydroxylase MiaE [bacterium]